MCLSASAAGKLSASFDVKETPATTKLKASDIDCVEIKNIMIAEFNSEGNIIASAENGQPSYFTFKISADEGYVLDGLLIKTYASVNTFNDIECDFGLYISTTQKINYNKASRFVSGMLGKKNHKWTADSEIPDGATEIYVSVYFVNNSIHVDWIRFYTFEITATQVKKQVETESKAPETEPPAPDTEPPAVSTDDTVVTEPPVSETVTEEQPATSEIPATGPVSSSPETEPKTPETSGQDTAAPTVTDSEKPTGESGKSVVPVIIIAAAALVIIIATVALIAILKKK